MAPSSPDPHNLFEMARRARALARALLRDHASAEDVASEAVSASLRLAGEPPRGWLANKVRSLASRARRSYARRARREAVAARPEALPSAAELVERAELQRTLIAAVIALPEPYRSAVWMRYLEDLPPREIARRLGIPVRTVQTHLSRGLQRLRGRLGREPGRWALLARPCPAGPSEASPGPSPSILVTAGVLMEMKLKPLLIAAAAILLGALALRLGNEASPALPAPTASPGEHALSKVAKDEQPAGVPVADGRRARGAALDPGGSNEPAEAGAAPIDRDLDLFGRVIDPWGRPVPAALIVAQLQQQVPVIPMFPAEEASTDAGRTHSDQEGRFRFRLEQGPLYRLVVSHGLFATTRLADRIAGEEVRIGLSLPARIQGRVLQENDGSPVADAVLVLVEASANHVEERFEANSDETGAYRIEGIPSGSYRITAQGPHHPPLFQERLVRVESGQELELDVHLQAGLPLRGRVFAAATGLPVEGAEVRLWNGKRSVRTAQDGGFLLEYDPRQDVQQVRASAKGLAPSEVCLFKGQELPVELRIDLLPAVRAIGRVLDPEGRPLQGARIEAYGRLEARGTPGHVGALGPPSLDYAQTRSGADGGFVLEDLDPSHHTLVVRRRGGGTLVVDFPENRSSDGTADLGDLRLFEPALLRGRVVDRKGSAVTQAQVWIRGGESGRHRFTLAPSPNVDAYTTTHLRRVDDLGRFSAADLGPGRYSLKALCRGTASMAETSVLLREGENLRDIELVLDIDLEAFTVTGRVVGPAGDSVMGAIVTTEARQARLEAPVPVASIATREDGSFRLNVPDAGIYDLAVDVRFSGRPELCPSTLASISTGSSEVLIQLAQRGSIRGRVLGEDGTPSESCLVKIDVADGRWGGALAVPVDARGSFELPVPSGARVDLLAWDYRTNARAELRDVPEGTADVVLRLAP